MHGLLHQLKVVLIGHEWRAAVLVARRCIYYPLLLQPPARLLLLRLLQSLPLIHIFFLLILIDADFVFVAHSDVLGGLGVGVDCLVHYF